MNKWIRCTETSPAGKQCCLTAGHPLPHSPVNGLPWPPLTKVGTDATKCCVCGDKFEMNVNVFTEAGMRETQISGMCERCFDTATKEPEAWQDE